MITFDENALSHFLKQNKKKEKEKREPDDRKWNCAKHERARKRAALITINPPHGQNEIPGRHTASPTYCYKLVTKVRSRPSSSQTHTDTAIPLICAMRIADVYRALNAREESVSPDASSSVVVVSSQRARRGCNTLLRNHMRTAFSGIHTPTPLLCFSAAAN